MAVIASYEPWMDGTCVKLDNENNIINFVTSKNLILIIQKIYTKQ